MPISRRGFLRSAGGAAVALPFTESALFALEPPRSVQPRTGKVILNSNENPYGPFPSTLKEIERAATLVNRYPDEHYDELWGLLSKLHGVSDDQITLGCGSSDILRMASDAFLIRSKTLLQASPTFEALAMYVKQRGGNVVTVPLRADHAHDLEAMLAKSGPAPDIIYICNPNNPTGSITPRSEIEQFLAKAPKESVILLDEAYHHFATDDTGYVSFLDKHVDQANLIVARTFSKIYGLAGLRLGYAVGPKDLIAKLQRYYVYDNPNVIAVRAGVASLRDDTMLKTATRRNASDRDEFEKQAQSRKLRIIPSRANFVMFDTGHPIREVRDYFQRRNVLIGRPFPPYETFARISLGTPEEMKRFWSVWDEMTRVQ